MFRSIAVIAVVWTLAIPVFSQVLDRDGEKFKADLLAVYSKPDTARVMALVHPKSVACLKAEPKYQEYLMRMETMQPIPADAKVTVVEVGATEKLPFQGFEFPLRPTHTVRAAFGRQVLDAKSAVTQIAEKHIGRDGGRWYMILPCPTAEGMSILREMGLIKP